MSASATPANDLKTQKYDRQLRLWAATGQSALENANVCLLNATSTGCEILKNLILPGIGGVTVADGGVVDPKDISTNFFLESNSIGLPKAEAVIELLKELNDDVSASFVTKAPSELINNEPEFFDPFCMIVATDLHEEDSIKLSELCQRTNKVLINVRCKGLCGLFRVQSPEHTVIESHPENVVDLRLLSPFRQLNEYVDTFDLDSLDQTDHAHVPFVVVILKYLSAWKAEHGGEGPTSYSDRNQLKVQIRAGMRTVEEENFEEAMANVWRLASSSNNIPSEVQKIFEDEACQNITAESPDFWVIASAVKAFVANEGEGQLPLSGKLPDMKSDTSNYVRLQKVQVLFLFQKQDINPTRRYREKAQEDLFAVTAHVSAILESMGAPPDAVPAETIQSFCKNAAHVKVFKYRNMKDEYITSPRTEQIVSWIENDANMSFYITYRAADRFFAKKQRWPGSEAGDSAEDVELLQQEILAILQSVGISEEKAQELLKCDLMDKASTNYVRFANRETTNLAALIGGLVSQEAIKLITHQYIPINNTCVFNGIASTSSVFEL
ncbi:NEDD8-activating enzyme E1 regulatory subunit [Apophysomyces sp. BC1034]|nr:NEDD8-activating enzyme E1 regulatory subunit [Apophysomyces sp. BC1015]KAG0182851.1 NEDD8-activating enzyme E1 regulatory subunit [Apophysomyces sp. BC1021]KAG0194940.1 NEDD8-activating enzyme E1 regulatory subunit [Apophysomyces sp. BC1034]